MTAKRESFDKGLIVVGAVIFPVFLVLPAPDRPSVYYSSLFEASSTLKGGSGPSDLAQDLIGFRGLGRRQDPYPILGQAASDLNLDWSDVKHASTHPPTAFLLVAPLAFMPWHWASTIWAWLMLVLLTSAFRCFGLSWKASLGLTPISLLWPPIALSLGQLTIIWLSALAAGYQLHRSRRASSGIMIGVAALTKFLPALLLIPLLVKRQWQALWAFGSICVVSSLFLLLLSPQSLFRYVEVNRTTSPDMIWRADNSSLLLNSYRSLGWVGIILVAGLFVLIVWANRDCLHSPESFVSGRLWWLMSYFSVALLPVSWIYSITPLLPIMVSLVARKKLSTMTIGCLCLAIPAIIPAWGTPSVLPLVFVNVMVGVGLAVDGLPFRIFAARTVVDLVRASPARELEIRGTNCDVQHKPLN